MKINEKIAEVTTNFTSGETAEMSVDSNSMAHIMNTLTDMYKNPWEALARELISNGLDAHAAQFGIPVTTSAVFPKPVEVSIPTDLNPEFIVKDYGIGMSRDILMNVFPKYGASTKRDSNDQIGGFGLGAKTPFAVSENFVVETVHNGKKNVAIFQKNERGVGEGHFLPEQDTDAANGTVIRVTLRDTHRLAQVFRDSNLFLGLPAGGVLIDGKPAKESLANEEQYVALSDSLGWVKNFKGNDSAWNYRGVARAVIGTVSYELNEIFGRSSTAWQSTEANRRKLIEAFSTAAVLNIPIGTVDLTPSRDSLIFSQRTNAALVALYSAAYDAYIADVQVRIDAADSDTEVLELVTSAQRILNRWDGHETPQWTKDGEVIPVFKGRFDVLEDVHAYHVGGHTSAKSLHVNDISYLILGATDAEQVQALSRNFAKFRKGISAESNANAYVAGKPVFMTGDLTGYSRWVKANIESRVNRILTVEEFLTVVEAGREIEREIARATRAANKALREEHGIDQEVNVYRNNGMSRMQISAVGTFSKNIAYVSANRPAGTLSNTYALPANRSKIKEFARSISIGGVNDFALIFLPKTVNLDVFAKQFPAIKAVEDFLEALPQAQPDDLEDVAAKAVISTRAFRNKAGWLFMNGMTDDKIAEIVNAEFRAWAEKSRKLGAEVYDAYSLQRGYLSPQANASYDSVVFTALPGFSEAKKAYEAAIPTYSLLANLEPSYSKGVAVDEVIEYINLKNPA